MAENDMKSGPAKTDKLNLAEILGVDGAKAVQKARVMGEFAYELENHMLKGPYSGFAAVESMPDSVTKKPLYAALAFAFAKAKDCYLRDIKEHNTGSQAALDQLEQMRAYCDRMAGYGTPGTPTG